MKLMQAGTPQRPSGWRPSGWRPSARESERGVALAIVVWFIAGMSLLVVGMVSQARLDTRMAQLHVARAKAVAAGDGAIRLMLAERLLVPRPAAADLLRGDYQIGDTSVSVTLYPEAALINMNQASYQTLVALFELLAGLLPDEANLLADNVLKWRGDAPGADNKKSVRRDFKSAEDVLRVNGLSRTVFDAIRDYIVVGNSRGSTTDWAQAPEALLAVLKETQPDELQRVLQQRETRPETEVESPGSAQRTLSGFLRADALVHYGDQYWLRRHWVSLGGAAPGGTLPWRSKRTEPPRVYGRRGGVD
ncbi:type II secretion system protein GspK [Candidatus Marimicrobium litorale]|uniref:General secretion pathway protein GspK n=1 Tax=Candidatus Marimicrobium litorale TaxID=2518991 RepID=A0ABT3T5K3_9GAMM|nr:type II secretion system protein GspK [Candidatus Marimicrobium litorale]MCX2977560.1 general secretion pathway protein GspK [Candidatus Marimicrobium litorale]